MKSFNSILSDFYFISFFFKKTLSDDMMDGSEQIYFGVSNAKKYVAQIAKRRGEKTHKGK
jgi:hypothetical protein